MPRVSVIRKLFVPQSLMPHYAVAKNHIHIDFDDFDNRLREYERLPPSQRESIRLLLLYRIRKLSPGKGDTVAAILASVVLAIAVLVSAVMGDLMALSATVFGSQWVAGIEAGDFSWATVIGPFASTIIVAVVVMLLVAYFPVLVHLGTDRLRATYEVWLAAYETAEDELKRRAELEAEPPAVPSRGLSICGVLRAILGNRAMATRRGKRVSPRR